MVKVPVGFVCRAIECCLSMIMHFLHQFCSAHIFSHKYAIPHFVSPINRIILNEVGIGGAVIVNGVSRVGAGGEGSGVPFCEGGERDAGGGGNDVFQLNIGLCNDIEDGFDSRDNESLTFFPACSGNEGDGVVDPDRTIESDLDVPCGFAVTSK